MGCRTDMFVVRLMGDDYGVGMSLRWVGKWRIRVSLNNLQSDDQHGTWSKVLVLDLGVKARGGGGPICILGFKLRPEISFPT